MEGSYPCYSPAKICGWWPSIVSVVKELYQVTVSLYQEVHKRVPKENRDEQIERINKFLEERQALLDKFQPPYSEEESKIGQQIVQINKVIDTQLEKIFADIKMDLKELKIKKEQSTKYSNPYESIATDGIFFDKRN